MNIRAHRHGITALLAVAVFFGVATGCSSSDSGDTTPLGGSLSSAQAAESEDQADPDYSASIAPTPPLDAESVEPTEATATPSRKSEPTREAENGFTRQSDVVPCEQSLDIDVINVTVPGSSKVYLDRVLDSDKTPYVKYGETCRYILSGTGSYVAFVTSELLTDKGKDNYRHVCANADVKFKNFTVRPIPYQYYRNIQDGCTFAPRRTAPSDMLPGFVLRDGNWMVTVYLSGFDKVASDGEAVIRKVKLDPES